MFEKVSPALDAQAREQEVIRFWNENNIFKKSIDHREGNDVFTFYDGPPTANGKPHIGHIETRAIKDLIPRYPDHEGQKGARARPAGIPTDCRWSWKWKRPLGLDGKEQIEEYGIEPFIQECKKSVWKYKGEWEKMSERVGYWADMEHPYITYDNQLHRIRMVVAEDRLPTRGCCTRATRSCPTAPAAAPRCPAMRFLRATSPSPRRSAVVRFKVEGRGEHLSLRLDHHALDPAQQRGAVREPQRDLRPVRLRRAAPSSWARR